MNENIKSFYLTYKGRVATPNFPNGEGVASKVVALAQLYLDLGFEMEIHGDLTMKTISSDDGEQEKTK